MATTKATTLAHTLGGIAGSIETAEINRLDGVNADIQTQLDNLNTAKAPKASPTFTGTITAPNDSISGDAVSGGTIGAGTFNGTIGSSATGIPTQSWAYASGVNQYSGTGNTEVEWGGTRIKSGFTFGPSDNSGAYQIKPTTTGYYFINYTINFWNEPPNSGTEDDSGNMRLYFNTTHISTVHVHFHITTNPTNQHEGDHYGMSMIHQVTSTGTDDWFSVRALGFNTITGVGASNYNETHNISIIKVA